MYRVKYWEIIADNLSKAGWSWGCVSAVDAHGRTIWIADAHRGNGKRFVVRADEKLTAFLELAFALARFGFSIQRETSSASFRSTTRRRNFISFLDGFREEARLPNTG
jgi:hypothetical protein